VSFLGGVESFLQGAGSAINIPDKRLLFRGELRRIGGELRLVGDNGQSFSIPGYFTHAERPPLICPEGAALPGNVVDSGQAGKL
jgi:hypothetical protein